MVLKIYESLGLLDVFDLIKIAVVSYSIILNICFLIDGEIVIPEISCIRSSCRILLLKLDKNIVIVIQMAEHHDVHILEASLYLDLGTAEVV